MIVAGLDLAGNPRRCSGYAEIDAALRRLAGVACLRGDDEILERCSGAGVVAVDAPLAPEPVMRELDRLAIRRGYRVLPPSIGGMRILTRRAWALREGLVSRGVVVIETHPKSVLKSSGAGDPGRLLDLLGISRGRWDPWRGPEDLGDAVAAAAAAYCFHARHCSERLEASDGVLYLVRPLTL